MRISSKSSSSASNQPEGSIPIREKIGYGLGDTASNFYWKFFENFLLYFYTDVFGISSKAAGSMLLITKIWDAINDPVMGYLADRTRTAWGRFRPYLLWMSLPLAITAVLCFYVPDLSDSGKLAYAYITYTLVMMAYTAINIPYGALMGVITPDSLERTTVSTYRFVCAFIGGIIVQTFTLSLVAWFGQTDQIDANGNAYVNEAIGYFSTMMVFSAAAVVLFIVCFATTQERVQPEQNQESTLKQDWQFVLCSRKLHQILLVGGSLLVGLSLSFDRAVLPWILVGYLLLSGVSLVVSQLNRRQASQLQEVSTLELDFNNLMSNRPWFVLFLFGLFQLMAAFLRGGATMYYFKYFVGDSSWFSYFLVAGSLAAIGGMLLTRPLSAALGKRRLMVLMNLGTAFFMALLFVISPKQILLIFVLHILGSFVSGPSPVLLWAMYADVADYSEWKFRRRATGLIFSAATFSQKMGVALGAAMTGWVLHWIGYLAPVGGVEVAQSETTLLGLKLMMSLFPAVLLIAAAASLLFYEINQSLAQQIEEELGLRKNAGIQKQVGVE